MRRLLFTLFGLIALSAYSQTDSIPELSIGQEIGTVINETLSSLEGTVLRVSESDLGQTAIAIAIWKLLYKDVIGLIVGIIFMIISFKLATSIKRLITKSSEHINNNDGIILVFDCIAIIVCIIVAFNCIF